MNIEDKLKCKICNNTFQTFKHISKHVIKYHKISSNDYYDRYLKKENEGICCVCGNITKYLNLNLGYRIFCSNKCSNNSEIKKKKINQINLEKYGVENPSQIKEIKEKKKQKSIEKYGTTCTLQANEIQNKIKENNIKKYNSDVYIKSNDFKIKRKNSYLKHYGVENYTKTDEYKLKLFNVWLNEFKDRIKKYDLKFIFKNSKYISLYCNICNNTFNIPRSTLNAYISHDIEICPYCNPKFNGTSNEEKNIVNYIKSKYDGKIVENDRNILKGSELDIYLPDLNIAFEFDGLYYHSINFKDKNYHLNKTVECEKQGILLVHIFENEWYNNNEQIKNYIEEIISKKLNINSFVFKKENDTIIIDRKLYNGKLLETLGYKLKETTNPVLNEISFKGKIYKIYNCGSLIYEYRR